MLALPVGPDQAGLEGMQMGLVAGRNHQGPAFDLGKALGLETGPQSGLYPAPADAAEDGGRHGSEAFHQGICGASRLPAKDPAKYPVDLRGFPVVSVIASSVRKGNVLEKDGKLYLVLTAENIHPGKGTPVTHLEMRRISDGVKTVERLRTTDSVEKAFVEHQNYQLSLPGRRAVCVHAAADLRPGCMSAPTWSATRRPI